VTQVTIPSCPNRSSTSPSRSRRVKTRHRKPGKGSSGDLAGLKAQSQSTPRGGGGGGGGGGGVAAQDGSSAPDPAKHLLDPSSAALRATGHDQQQQQQRQLSSSSPDLICTALESSGSGQGKGGPAAVCGLERGGSVSASAVLGGRSSEAAPGGLEDPTETPPRSDTPSEDAASFPFSSSPDSPCGRMGAAARRASLGVPRLPHDGEDKEEGAGAVRMSRGSSAGGVGGQHLTPSAILYRAAISRKQVSKTSKTLSKGPRKKPCLRVSVCTEAAVFPHALVFCLRLQRRGVSSEEEEGEVDSEVELPRRR